MANTALGPLIGAATASRTASMLGGGGLAKTLLGVAGKAVPWLGPALLAADLLPKLFGRGRKQANIWNEQAFTPISQRLASIFDETTAGRKAGTLSREDAESALRAFDAQVEELQSAGDQFSELGDKQSLVVRQSRDLLGGSIDQWRKGLQGHIDALPMTDRSNEEAPTMGTLLASLGQTPEDQARKRADQERKRMASGGLRSTLMTGPSGIRSAAPGQRRTLLGY